MKPGRAAFLALVLAQAAHSIEEYFNRLYDVLAPARFVSGLFSSDLRTGFIIFNVLLVAFGFVCFFGPVLRGSRSAPGLAWLWVILEFLNGCAHMIWAASAGSYRPGLVTAPFLVAIAAILGRKLTRAA
ncbi:MAG: HXXEE domain-containing protein [Thermoanaerobaculia bacterium]